MTLLSRIALLVLFTSFVTGCDMMYVAEPTQPAPTRVYGTTYSQPDAVRVPPAVYPTQPQAAQVPAPIQTPPLPPSVPAKAPVRAAPQPPSSVSHTPAAVSHAPVATEEAAPGGNVIPVRAPGSISELPDPS